MKLKKLLAVVLSAVMAVSVLSACGGGSGIGGSSLTGPVNGLLKEAGSDAVVETSSALNGAVQQAIKDDLVKGAGIDSQWAVYNAVRKEMDWQLADGCFTFVISDSNLKNNKAIDLVVEVAGWIHWVGFDFGNTEELAKLGDGKIDTAEELAAALVLLADTSKDAGQSYSVTAQTTETDAGVAYWVFALQVN